MPTPSQRRYPRTLRLNELIHQILAEALERIDDDRLYLVTVMSVEVESDMRHAIVYVDTPEGDERDESMLAGLNDHRVALQRSVGRQARMKRTPLLTFRPDEVERGAARVEQVLRHLDEPDT